MPASIPRIALTIAVAVLLLAVGCSVEPAPGADDRAPVESAQRLRWAIAIHGGAGIYRDVPADRERAMRDGMSRVARLGVEMLEGGHDGLDVVEAIIRDLEDDPVFNAGRGAVLDHEGGHQLDASIMDGRDLSCGAVAGVRTVRHPIALARLVMTETRHVLLAGPGAEAFADGQPVERVEPEWFTTPRRRESWERYRADAADSEGGGTVGVVVLDAAGHLAAGTSTGGLTGKRWGRVGDSPIVGAGTWADDRSVAVSCTGRGEEFIRRAVARRVASLVELGGLSLAAAAHRVIDEELSEGDGGLIAVDRHGRIAMAFNTGGMARAAADSDGRFEVAIGRE